jgi:hypothetical protein
MQRCKEKNLATLHVCLKIKHNDKAHWRFADEVIATQR